MNATRLDTASVFLDRAAPSLLADEVRDGLGFGIAKRAAEDPHAFGSSDPWFLVVEDADRLLATAVCTPPHRPILACFTDPDDEPIARLVSAIHRIDPQIPGAVGERRLVDRFAQRWCKAHGAHVTASMAQRIYKLTHLEPVPRSPGRLRIAGPEDLALVQRWAAAFQREASPDEPTKGHRDQTRDRIDAGDIVLWDDEGPVSTALKTRPTGQGISIGGVFTPPDRRNRGYASSCVAGLCEDLLATYAFCVLYTDLANPTSNAIYQRIGFRPHTDSQMITLAPGSSV